MTLQVHTEWWSRGGIARLQEIFSPYRNGLCPVQMQYLHEDAQVSISLGADWYLSPQDELIYEVKNLLGADNVELVFH